MNMMTAKEARDAANNRSETILTLNVILRAVAEAARRGRTVYEPEELSENDKCWLERNGYTVWEKACYMKVRYLISWEEGADADTI